MIHRLVFTRRGAAVRIIGLAVTLVALSAVIAGAAAAKPGGPGPGNSPNAKLCQMGGWQNLVRSDGTSFAGEEECTAYAAQGGTLQTKPMFPAAQALCASHNGTFGVGGPDLVNDGAPGAVVLWVCNDVPRVDSTPTLQGDLTAQCRAENPTNPGMGNVVSLGSPTSINFTCYDRGGD